MTTGRMFTKSAPMMIPRSIIANGFPLSPSSGSVLRSSGSS